MCMDCIVTWWCHHPKGNVQNASSYRRKPWRYRVHCSFRVHSCMCHTSCPRSWQLIMAKLLQTFASRPVKPHQHMRRVEVICFGSTMTINAQSMTGRGFHPFETNLAQPKLQLKSTSNSLDFRWGRSTVYSMYDVQRLDLIPRAIYRQLQTKANLWPRSLSWTILAAQNYSPVTLEWRCCCVVQMWDRSTKIH